MSCEVFDRNHDWHNVVLIDRVVAKRPHEWIGPSALVGQVIPAVLAVTTVTVASDTSPSARRSADLFARAAIHGGYATGDGFIWNKITSIAVGATGLDALLCRLDGAAGAHFTGDADGLVTIRLFLPDGTTVIEDNGLGALRARLATGRAAQPVNSYSIGTLLDHRELTADSATTDRRDPIQ